MREKTIRILEYNKILTKLEEQAGSEMAKRWSQGSDLFTKFR